MKNSSVSLLGADGPERFGDAVDEGRVQAVVREALPLHQHRPLADRGQIRQADIGPLGNRPHVDQHRVRVTLQPRPCLFHRNGLDVDSPPTLLSTPLQRRINSVAAKQRPLEKRRLNLRSTQELRNTEPYCRTSSQRSPELRILGLHSETLRRTCWRVLVSRSSRRRGLVGRKSRAGQLADGGCGYAPDAAVDNPVRRRKAGEND